MKILHVTPGYFADVSHVGGGERYVNNVCKALSQQGAVECSDALSFGPSHREITLFPKSRLRIIAAKPNPLFDIESVASSNFREYLAEYDVIHVHQCLTNFGLFMGSHAQLMGKRTLGTDHGGGETHLYRAHPFLFDNFDILHAQSEFARYSFADAVRGTHVIKGPVDDDAFPMADAEHRDPRLFVAIGRYLPHKGFESLIDCLPQGCRLVIVGRPYDEEYLRFLVSRIGSKSVELKTTLSDEELLRLVGRAGLYLHSSVSSDFRGTIYLKSELLGLAPLESMCTGAPVICSDTAALQELGALRGCRTYRTKEQLSVLLTQYLDGTLRFPESSLIRDDACKHYGLAQFAEKYVAMLNMVN